MGSWKGRGNQYIQFARVLYCKLPTNGKQTQLSYMDVGFHSNFCFGWEGCGLVSGSLLLVL